MHPGYSQRACCLPGARRLRSPHHPALHPHAAPASSSPSSTLRTPPPASSPTTPGSPLLQAVRQLRRLSSSCPALSRPPPPAHPPAAHHPLPRSPWQVLHSLAAPAPLPPPSLPPSASPPCRRWRALSPPSASPPPLPPPRPVHPRPRRSHVVAPAHRSAPRPSLVRRVRRRCPRRLRRLWRPRLLRWPHLYRSCRV